MVKHAKTLSLKDCQSKTSTDPQSYSLSRLNTHNPQVSQFVKVKHAKTLSLSVCQGKSCTDPQSHSLSRKNIQTPTVSQFFNVVDRPFISQFVKSRHKPSVYIGIVHTYIHQSNIFYVKSITSIIEHLSSVVTDRPTDGQTG